MKFLLVIAVVLIGFFVWRSSRVARKPPPAPPDPAGGAKMIDMVRCDVCGVHCPKTDAVAGRLGVYCGVQHKQQAEP